MSKPAQITLAIAGISLLVATGLGAFAAHGLDRYLDAESVATFRIGVQYHFFHGLGLIGVGLLRMHLPRSRSLALSAWLMLAGTVLFSGSIYLLPFDASPSLLLVLATPLGGLCFLAAWLCFAYGAWAAHGGAR